MRWLRKDDPQNQDASETEDTSRRKQLELNQLTRPFWAALVIGSISLLLFVSYLTIAMDRSALSASEQTFQSIMNDRFHVLENAAEEQGFWDQAIDKMVYSTDEAWIEQNIISHLAANYHVAGIHLFDEAGGPVLNIYEGEWNAKASLAQYGDAVSSLIDAARVDEQGADPTVASGYLGTQAQTFMASAIEMTTYTDEENINTGQVMLITMKIDERYIADIRETYDLSDLAFGEAAAGVAQAQLAVRDGNGSVLGRFVWSPYLAGSGILPALAVGVLTVFLAMLFTARTYLRRATRLIVELEQARMEAEFAKDSLDRLSKEDALTGLGNRRKLDRRLKKLQLEDMLETNYAFMSIDLDGFKQINDTHGHEAGDAVLQQFAELFSRAAGERAETFRLGGDEFCAIFKDMNRREIKDAGQKLLDALREDQFVDGKSYSYGASIGVTFSTNVDNWLHEADQALYAVKRNGRHAMEIFDASIDYSKAEAAA